MKNISTISLVAYFYLLYLLVSVQSDSSCPNYFGRDGRDGNPGRDGVSVIGPPGRDGIDGVDGLDCVECAKGPKGDRGEKGANGGNGKPGIQGVKGSTGAQGMKGSKGSTGASGRKGDLGSKGLKGEKGVCDVKVLQKLQSDIASLQATVSKLSGLLDSKGKIKQSILPAGYDKFSFYDMQWQSLHMAAAAACRGSTASGGTGGYANSVYPRKHGVNCKTVCSQTTHRNCDAEVSLHGLVKKATSNSRHVGYFYNYGCDVGYTFGDEVKSSNEILGKEIIYTSYCCCRQ